MKIQVKAYKERVLVKLKEWRVSRGHESAVNTTETMPGSQECSEDTPSLWELGGFILSIITTVMRFMQPGRCSGIYEIIIYIPNISLLWYINIAQGSLYAKTLFLLESVCRFR